MKKIIAAVLVIAMVMSIASVAFADEGEEMIETVAIENVEEVETEEVEVIEETAETEEVEAVEEEEEVITATAYARISCDHRNESVDEGTVITLTADLSNIEGEIVSITWQYTADNGNTVHTASETGAKLSFTASEETVNYLWRAIITYTVAA